MSFLTQEQDSFLGNLTQVPTTVIYCILILFLWLKCNKQRNEVHKASIAEKLEQNNYKLLPTPPAMPIIGHIHLLRDHQHNPWLGFDAIRRQLGDVVGLKMGIHPMVLVSSNEVIKEILLKKGDIFSNRPTFPRHQIIFGGNKENSLALCNWSGVHRDRRKLCKRGVVPNKFSSRNQLLELIISKLVVKFVDDIQKQVPNYLCRNHQESITDNTSTLSPNLLIANNPQLDASFDKNLSQLHNRQQQLEKQPQHYFNITKLDILYLTSDIFVDFLCGEKYTHSDMMYKEFVKGCDFVFWDINQSYLIDFLPILTSLGIGHSYLKKLKRVTDFLRDFIEDNIFKPRHVKHIDSESKQRSPNIMMTKSENLETFVSITSEHQDEDQSDSNNSEDYLDSIILEYMSKVTSMTLDDYKVGFADLIAGHAAVANILMRLLGHLALDKNLQDLICEEATNADIPNLQNKPHLPITEAALQEALRIASSPIIPHVAREDTCIDQFYVPKGTMVLFNNYHLNLSKELWDDPMKFDPLRFLKRLTDGKYKLDVPKHFIPFSIGKRQCLGYKMVETTTIVTVANLCKRFVMRANDETLVTRLLSPKGSIALDPESRCFDIQLYPR